MAEIQGFRGRNVAVMSVSDGCVVSVNGVGRRYEDMPAPDGVVTLCWDRGEGVVTLTNGRKQPFTAFDTLAPWLERWAADQAIEDAEAEAELQARLRAARARREAAEMAQRSLLDAAIDARIDERKNP